MKKQLYALIFIVIIILLMIQCSSNTDNKKEIKKNQLSYSYDVTNYDELIFALKECYSITLKNDIFTENELVLEGDFSKTDTELNNVVTSVGRVINLGGMNNERKIGEKYKLVSPKLIIKSKNTIISGGTYVGDIYVERNGFTLEDVKIEGNVIFKDLKTRDSFVDGDNTTILGEIIIK